MTTTTGTVVVVGHPANGLTATAQPDGTWMSNTEPRRLVSQDDVDHGARIIYRPVLERAAHDNDLTPRQVMVGKDAVPVVDATVLAHMLDTHVRTTALLVDTSHAHALMRVLRRVLPYDQDEREALRSIHIALQRHLVG